MKTAFNIAILLASFALSGCLFAPAGKNAGSGRKVIDGVEGADGLFVPGPKGDSAGFLGIVSKVLYDVGEHTCPNGQTFPYKSALVATQDKTYRQFDPCANDKVPADNENVEGGTPVTGVVASPVGIAHLDNTLFQTASLAELEEGDSRLLDKAGIWCVYPAKSKTPSETIEAKEFVFYLKEKNFTFFSTTYRKDRVENIAVLGGAESFGLYSRAHGKSRGLDIMQQRIVGKTVEGYLQIYVNLLIPARRGAFQSNVKIHQTWVNDYPEFAPNLGHTKGYCYVDSSVMNFTSTGAILKQKR